MRSPVVADNVAIDDGYKRTKKGLKNSGLTGIWRRRADLNRRIKLLQSFALPLGDVAVSGETKRIYTFFAKQCQWGKLSLVEISDT